jgi:hypothetical protein
VKTSARMLICSLALIVFVAPADSALGAGLTLELSAPPSVVVAQPAILHATGTIPVEDLEFPYWFSLDAIPTSVTTTCPADHFAGQQLAQSTGGAILVLTQREAADEAGSFSIPIGVTPTAPGSVLLCGYTDDGLTSTLARASLTLRIERPGTSNGGPGPARIAGEAARAVRSCRAVLSPSESKPCIRRAVGHANSRCRRLNAPRSRTKCLRAVRRASRAS